MSNKSVSLAQGYAPLYNPFEQFFSRYVYRRVRHIFNRPICSAPGAEVTLKERCTDDYNWSFRYTHTHTIHNYNQIRDWCKYQLPACIYSIHYTFQILYK